MPFVSQAWYTGPVAATGKTGDLGMVVAGGAAAVGYVGMRGVWTILGRRVRRDAGDLQETEGERK